MEKWRYIYTKFKSRQWVEVTDHLHAPAALSLGKEPQVPIE
jgi:hypothetical protein